MTDPPQIDSTATSLEQQLAAAPSKSGVYLMKNDQDIILYVGKALDLKKRLTSYFRSTGQRDPKTAVLVSKIARIETVITTTEKEALILESNLIKKHRPRYNVVLKDDKRYLSLRLNLNDPYPNLTLVRKIKKDGARYFGPYASAAAVRQTLKFIQRTFKLRKCNARTFKVRTRPCLNCQMGSCLGPCCNPVAPSRYHEAVKEVILFLKGRTPELIGQLKQQMAAAAAAEHFERAAELRDKLFALEKTLEKQVTVNTDFMDRDVLVAKRDGSRAVITLMTVRGGYLEGSRHYPFAETMARSPELLSSFIGQYYHRAELIPKEILVSRNLEDTRLLEEQLTEIKQQRVSILRPLRGEKARLLRMAQRNVQRAMDELVAQIDGYQDLLQRLQRKLTLVRLPRHIECFDNSNIQGSDPVSAMVVFSDGKPEPSSYRHFLIKSVVQPNDYAAMVEVLDRRYSKTSPEQSPPDLILLDGGKGQLNVALSVIRELGFSDALSLAAIAKKDEQRGETEDKIYIPGRANPIAFGRDRDLLLFLARIRDEAHRFAISFHRRQRAKRSIASSLDRIPGIGHKRKTQLLNHFGSIEKIRAASTAEISALPGINPKIADAIKAELATDG